MYKRQLLRAHPLRVMLAMLFVAALGLPLIGLSSKASAVASRPNGNTGTGFFVRDGEVYDPNGNPHRIRGLNHTHWWGNNNEATVEHIAKAKPNTVRVVFGSGMGADTPAEQRSVIQQYIQANITPMIEYHDATCDNNKADLDAVVNLWLDPARVAYLKEFERQVILNIANEWGPNDATWRDAYKDAITRLRNAGVKNMLVIDAGGNCGQSPRAIQAFGQELLDHDPQRNVLFSVHMYGFWRTEERANEVGTWGDAPWDITRELTDIKVTRKLPLIVGEFSWDACQDVGYKTRRAVEIFEQLGIGWLGWSWNQNSNPCLDMARGYQYNSDNDLTEWGKFIINDPNLGLKKFAQQPMPTPGTTTTAVPSATVAPGTTATPGGAPSAKVYLPLALKAATGGTPAPTTTPPATSPTPGTTPTGTTQPPTTTGYTTYHLGNSLTDTIDGWLKPVADSAGYTHTFYRTTIPGAPTDWIWDHPGGAFGEADYRVAFDTRAPIEYLFTQPFAGHCRSIENEAEYSGRFYRLAREKSPNIQHWLYVQWPAKNFDDCWSKGQPYGGGITLTPAKTWEEGVANHIAYTEAVRQRMDDQNDGKGILIVPGGPALAKLKQEIEGGRVPGINSFFDTHFSDDLHLSTKGRYMIALVHFAAIYKRSPEGVVTAERTGLTAEQARMYQRIAWDTVKNYRWSGVTQ